LVTKAKTPSPENDGVIPLTVTFLPREVFFYECVITKTARTFQRGEGSGVECYDALEPFNRRCDEMRDGLSGPSAQLTPLNI
jgi:hypothetical protein